MKIIFLLIAISFFFIFPFYSNAACNLTAPKVTVINVTACEIAISWKPVMNAAYYKVRIKKTGDNKWGANVKVGDATNYTFSGLEANAEYTTQVTPFCSNDSKGPLTHTKVTTQFCSLPENVEVTDISNKSATVIWNVCGGGANSQVRYRVKGNTDWKVVKAQSSTSVKLTGLNKSMVYQYGVNTCNDESLWTPTSTFKTLDTAFWKPNILVIYLDDSRYDPFAPNGGPSFYKSPGINRIANEGVRFVYAFPATSLCSPSRASIMTGLYPHHHGVISNATVKNLGHVTAAEILHGQGYYTGFVGKYGFEQFPDVDGYDYYCESSTDQYWDAKYDYNGDFNVVIPGHKTDVITSKSLEFLNAVPAGKKFLLYVAHKAPHVPLDPRTQDLGIYADKKMPFPNNFEKWEKNIPSEYYECSNVNKDSEGLNNQLESYYEMLAGAEASIDTILTTLDRKGILDSTLVIFSSDNGLMIGEHGLGGKEIATEESIRLPMFLRYPKWFVPGTVVNDEMAMNIDIAPTILDAAGIPDTFKMDGISMRGLVDHTSHRKELLYEYFYRGSCNPTITAVRDFNYKYIDSRCTSTVEEFYDLVNDPKENLNLINSSNYGSEIQKYRDKMDSLKQVYGYILLADTIEPCKMYHKDESIIKFRDNQEYVFPDFTAKIYPNPGSQQLTIELHLNEAPKAAITIYDLYSIPVMKKDINGGEDIDYKVTFELSSLPAGVYFIGIDCGSERKLFRYLKID
ncbi:MAG: sulfatase-like hydrolase/transferase [Chitinophagales bacterium]|nr:sulfatase-like hydrolase/transferase [Chitinophagales bacterium]